VSEDGAGAMAGASACAAPDPEATAVTVVIFPMAAGLTFDWHTHADHQLAWASSGVLTVVTRAACWVLPPTRALWIPAGLPHETKSSGRATMRALYVRPDLCPISWPEPTPVAARPLLAELIGYLEREPLDQAQRVRAEALLVDLLTPVAMATIEVRMPVEDRAREVADALSADPADRRTLAQWGRQVGASGRTLARSFLADTGVPFGRWRTLLRLQAALLALAGGEPVGNVARHVGYETASSFVAAFHRETGMTPAAYFRPAAYLRPAAYCRPAGGMEPDAAGLASPGLPADLPEAAGR
jgi:AraC-like DNA-binding protein/quercetin dioxygenase-like cupin family protein